VTAASPHSRTAIVGAALLAIAFAFCYRTVFAGLAAQWWGNNLYSHGFLVPIIAGYVAWHRWSEAPVTPRPSPWIGALVLALGLVMLVVGRAGSIQALQQVSLLPTLAGSILLLLGVQGLRRFWLPLAYLLFMIPIWEILTGRLHQPFQLMSASFAGRVLNGIGIPLLQQGTLLELPQITLEVAEACSGVNQLIAVVAIAVPAAYMFLDSNRRRIALVAFALAVAALSNSIRISLIGVLAYYGYAGDTHGPAHILQGMAVSVVGYIAIFAGLSVLARWNDTAPIRTAGRPRVIGLFETFGGARACIPIALVLIMVGARSATVYSVPLTQSMLPAALDGWSVEPGAMLSPVHVSLPGIDDERFATYRALTGERIYVYIGYQRVQTQGKELVGEATATLHHKSRPVRLSLPDKSVEVNYLEASVPQSGRRLLFWYNINGRIVANQYEAKAYTVWDTLVRGRSNGAVVLLEWDGSATEAPDQSLKRATEFARALIPLLERTWIVS